MEHSYPTAQKPVRILPLFTFKNILSLLALTLLGASVSAQSVVFSETFVSGQTSTAQCTNWNTFRAQLTTRPYYQVRLSGSNGSFKECTNPALVQQMAAALRTLTAGTWVDGSNTWQIASDINGRFGVNMSSLSACDNPGYIVKPCIGNTNWGGVNTATCGGPTQVITLEFTYGGVGANNASTTNLVSPVRFCAGSQPVKVRIANKGNTVINMLNVGWELDGVPQTGLVWNSPLDTIGGAGATDTVVTLGTVNFAAGFAHTLRVWTAFPNGATDPITSNDTLTATVKPALNGSYTIGLAGDYTSFTAAVADLNNFGICGPVVFNVAAGETFTENPITLTCSGTATNTITFQKSGVGANPIVYGKNGTGTIDAVIAIAGVSYATFNGIDVADSVSNATNTTRMEYGYGVVNYSTTLGSNNNVIKNCKITLNRANTATVGLAQSTLTTAVSFSGANHNNRYENIRVENSYSGILLQGTAAFPDSNNVITSSGTDTTVIGSLTAGDIGGSTVTVSGITAAEQKNVEISNCVVRNLLHTSTTVSQGILLNNTSATSLYGTARIFNNRVYNLNRTSTSTTGSMCGIRVEAAVNAAAKVYNNIIYGITTTNPTSATATQTLRGISHGNTTGTGPGEYYYNTVSLDNSSVNPSSSCLWKAGTSNVIVKNNIFSNANAAQTGTAKHYAIYLSAGTIQSSNNVLWAPNGNGFVGYTTADRLTLPLWAAATTTTTPAPMNEAGSSAVNPGFVSATDLTFTGFTPAAQSATPVSGITTDITGAARSATQPSIGAYETVQPLRDSVAPVISNVQIVSGTNPAVRATVYENNPGTLSSPVYLWYRTGSSGSFTAMPPDSTPAGILNGTYKWDAGLSLLGTGIYQFYITARDNAGPGLNVGVSPAMSVSFTAFNTVDPPNYATNPDAAANTWSFTRTTTLVAGIYTVGPGGNYPNLTAVANVLGAAELTGNVVFELQNNYDGTSGETFPITFNPFVSNTGSWTATIRPAAGVSNRETSGWPASGSSLINLSGTTRITLDGRPGGTGTASQWTIRNKRSAATFSPTIQFMNGAQRNTLNYLNIESANGLATSGTVMFGTTATVGNSYNTISNCAIRNRTDSAGVHAVGIYSSGSTATNDSNVITGNRISNFSTSGVLVSSTGNGNYWVISNNHFYNDLATPPATSQISIQVAATASYGHNISGNYIGGSQPFCAGNAWVNTGAVQWRGMTINVATTDSSYISGNTIQNINCSNTGSAALWCLELGNGLLSVNNNTFGHPTVANSIQSSLSALLAAIYFTSGGGSIYNNTFANFTQNTTTGTVGFACINYTVAGNIVIRNNRIFGFTTNNVATSATTSALRAIYGSTASTSQLITDNIIYDLKCGGGPTAATATLCQGIIVTSTGSGTISNNKVYNLTNSSRSATAQVIGINIDNGTAWNVVNNMVSLGANIDSSAVVVGIQDKSSGTNNSVYYNSVLISGNAVAATATQSFAFRRTTTAATNVRNNIFNNLRTGGTGNFAIGNTITTPATGWKANYNALYAANPAQLGLWVTSPADFITWQSTSQYDTASVNLAANFVSGSDLHLTTGSIGNTLLAGRPIAGVTTDYDRDARDPYKPYMGADENTASPLPVTFTAFDAKVNGKDVLLHWATASESHTDRFVLEASADGKHFRSVGTVKAKGNTASLTHYQFTHQRAQDDMQSSVIFYRISTIDMDGSLNRSGIIGIDFGKNLVNDNIRVFPNPFTQDAFISMHAEAGQESTIEVYDITGTMVLSQKQALTAGDNLVQLPASGRLDRGVYFVSIDMNGKRHVQKLVKE